MLNKHYTLVFPVVRKAAGILLRILGRYHKKFSTSCFEEISWHRWWFRN